MSTLMNALGAEHSRQQPRFHFAFPEPPATQSSGANPSNIQHILNPPPFSNIANFTPPLDQAVSLPFQASFPLPSLQAVVASHRQHAINPPALTIPAAAGIERQDTSPAGSSVPPTPMVVRIPEGPSRLPDIADTPNYAPPCKPGAFHATSISLESDIPLDREAVSHAARHPFRPVIPIRKREKKQTRKGDRHLLKANSKNSQRAEMMERFDQIGNEFQDLLQAAADDFKLTVEDVRRHVFKRAVDTRPTRKVNLWNAKMHKKAEELRQSNKLDGLGREEKLRAIREAVREDPDLCDLDADDSEGEELIQELEDSRKLQSTGLRASNKAAAVDYAATVKRLGLEARGLHLRTGARCLMFISKGHPTDPGDVEFVVSGGAEEFSFEVLKFHTIDVAGLFETWSCSKGIAPIARQTQQSMAKEVNEILEHGLFVLTNVKGIRVVYSDMGSISEKYAVELVGWPDEEDCPLVRPSKLLCPQLRSLLRALKERTCKWVRMSKARHTALCEDRLKNKKRKRRSDAGGKHKKARAEGSSDDDNDGDNDDNTDTDGSNDSDNNNEKSDNDGGSTRGAGKENERPRKRARAKASSSKKKPAPKKKASSSSKAKRAAPKSAAVIDSDLDDDI